MGAYTNPPIITEPNIAEIWSKNFKVGFEATEKTFERAKEFKKEEDFKRKQRAIASGKLREKAGSSEASVREFAVKKADGYAEHLRKYENDEIDQIEFIQGQGKYFSAINKIKELGDALKIKQEELAEEGKQISDYQGSKGILGLGLVTAAGNDSIEVFEDENGEFGVSYLSPVTGEPIKLSEADISDPKLYSINEKFDTSVVAETLKDDLKSHLTKQYDVSEYDIKSGGVAKVKTQVWDKPELKTKEGRVQYVKNSNSFKNITTDEAGSIYNDYVLKNERDILNDSDYIELKAKANLSKSQQAILDNLATNGFIDGKVGKEEESFNPADVLGELAKLKLAKQIVEEGPQDTKTKDIDTSSKTIEASLKARSGSGRAKPEVVSLVQNTFDGLIYSLERAEASGGDTNALAEFFNNVKSPSGGTFSPNAAGSDGVLYDSVANVIQIPTVINTKTGDFRVEEYRLDEPLGLEKLFTSVLSSRGVAKKDLPSAVNAFVETYSEFDPNIKLLSEENTDTEKPSLP